MYYDLQKPAMAKEEFIQVDAFSNAMVSEKKGDIVPALKIYEALLKADPANEKILSRLMILYRKQKNYKKEIKQINTLIKIQEGYYAPHKKKNSLVDSLSKKLNISLGRTDKKGNTLSQPDSINKLIKRKEQVQKKL